MKIEDNDINIASYCSIQKLSGSFSFFLSFFFFFFFAGSSRVLAQYRDWDLQNRTGGYFTRVQKVNQSCILIQKWGIIAAMMVIFVQLRKHHLPQRDDQAASSVMPIDR